MKVSGCSDFAVATMSAIAGGRVCFASGMEHIACGLGTFEWPCVFEAPLVFAHDEDFYGVSREVVLLAEQEIVVPLEDDLVLVVFGGCGAEVYGADVAASTRVAANHDEKTLAGAGSFIAPACALRPR